MATVILKCVFLLYSLSQALASPDGFQSCSSRLGMPYIHFPLTQSECLTGQFPDEIHPRDSLVMDPETMSCTRRWSNTTASSTGVLGLGVSRPVNRSSTGGLYSGGRFLPLFLLNQTVSFEIWLRDVSNGPLLTFRADNGTILFSVYVDPVHHLQVETTLFTFVTSNVIPVSGQGEIYLALVVSPDRFSIFTWQASSGYLRYDFDIIWGSGPLSALYSTTLFLGYDGLSSSLSGEIRSFTLFKNPLSFEDVLDRVLHERPRNSYPVSSRVITYKVLQNVSFTMNLDTLVYDDDADPIRRYEFLSVSGSGVVNGNNVMVPTSMSICPVGAATVTFTPADPYDFSINDYTDPCDSESAYTTLIFRAYDWHGPSLMNSSIYICVINLPNGPFAGATVLPAISAGTSTVFTPYVRHPDFPENVNLTDEMRISFLSSTGNFGKLRLTNPDGTACTGRYIHPGLVYQPVIYQSRIVFRICYESSPVNTSRYGTDSFFFTVTDGADRTSNLAWVNTTTVEPLRITTTEFTGIENVTLNMTVAARDGSGLDRPLYLRLTRSPGFGDLYLASRKLIVGDLVPGGSGLLFVSQPYYFNTIGNVSQTPDTFEVIVGETDTGTESLQPTVVSVYVISVPSNVTFTGTGLSDSALNVTKPGNVSVKSYTPVIPMDLIDYDRDVYPITVTMTISTMVLTSNDTTGVTVDTNNELCSTFLLSGRGCTQLVAHGFPSNMTRFLHTLYISRKYFDVIQSGGDQIQISIVKASLPPFTKKIYLYDASIYAITLTTSLYDGFSQFEILALFLAVLSVTCMSVCFMLICFQIHQLVPSCCSCPAKCSCRCARMGKVPVAPGPKREGLLGVHEYSSESDSD